MLLQLKAFSSDFLCSERAVGLQHWTRTYVRESQYIIEPPCKSQVKEQSGCFQILQKGKTSMDKSEGIFNVNIG